MKSSKARVFRIYIATKRYPARAHGVSAIQVDTAVKRGYNVFYQTVNNPQVQDVSKTFTSARDTVTKQFKDRISNVQDLGVEGSYTAAKEKAFAAVDESFLLVKRGKSASMFL